MLAKNAVMPVKQSGGDVMAALRMTGAVLLCLVSAAVQAQTLTFTQADDSLTIEHEGQPLVTYVYTDAEIPRPYFRDLFTVSGKRISRHHPPVAGEEPTDHATYHPGLWMAFGDISGADFWRNKAVVRHVRFLEEPIVRSGQAFFAVENSYESGDEVVCRARCRYALELTAQGWLLRVDTEFFNADNAFTFGDQEEMGLGVRVAAPLMVENGGTILNSEGRKDEAGAWGQQADWCSYFGSLDGDTAGVTLFTHPENFRASWFHARDYGLLLANPFGRAAFTDGQASEVRVEAGEAFRLQFGVHVFEGQSAVADAGIFFEQYVNAESVLPE
jgi:hypothetical protein